MMRGTGIGRGYGGLGTPQPPPNGRGGRGRAASLSLGVPRPQRVHGPLGERFVALDKIYATQRDIDTRGRLIHVDPTLYVKQDVGQWCTAIIRGHGDVAFTLCLYGINPKTHIRVKSFLGKMVDLIDVSVGWSKSLQVTANPFALHFNGPHASYGTLSNIEECQEDPSIPKALPARAPSQTPHMTLSTVREENFDDLKFYDCVKCGDGTTLRCSRTGKFHPSLCADCGLINCDTIVPFCAVKPATRHKPDPFPIPVVD